MRPHLEAVSRLFSVGSTRPLVLPLPLVGFAPTLVVPFEDTPREEVTREMTRSRHPKIMPFGKPAFCIADFRPGEDAMVFIRRNPTPEGYRQLDVTVVDVGTAIQPFNEPVKVITSDGRKLSLGGGTAAFEK